MVRVRVKKIVFLRISLSTIKFYTNLSLYLFVLCDNVKIKHKQNRESNLSYCNRISRNFFRNNRNILYGSCAMWYNFFSFLYYSLTNMHIYIHNFLLQSFSQDYDVASHTTYVMFFNFIHKWRRQFLSWFWMTDFWHASHGNFIYFQSPKK